MKGRHVIIDCANVGRWATDPMSNPAPFSSWKISAAVAAVLKQGLRPLAMCPSMFISGKNKAITADDPQELLGLQTAGLLEILKAGTFDGKQVDS